MNADSIYQSLLNLILTEGDRMESRNQPTYSNIFLPKITFTETPLLTLRKTAWKTALREMEWFLTGDSMCPEELRPWWQHQLNPDGNYFGGYGEQFRYSKGDFIHNFDQIQFIQDALKSNPNSRRLILTSWNPYDMAHITELNDNPNCPTTCHCSMVQFFVRNGKLHINSYQRSADMLLGVPHNWCQSWAMLMWFAHNANLEVGTMQWAFGDAHCYSDPSHIEAAQAIIACDLSKRVFDSPRLAYNGNGDFKASDFEIIGKIPEPVTKIKPILF